MSELYDVDDLELLEEYDLQNSDSDDSRSDGERGARGRADDDDDDDDDALEEPDFQAIYNDLKAQVVEIVSALGGLEEQQPDEATQHSQQSQADQAHHSEDHIDLVYIIGDDCLRCLRDLRKLWRDGGEDPERTVARVFAQVGVLQNLIPLLLKTAGDPNERHQKIALACTDLLTSITWPIDAEREVRLAKARGEDTNDLAYLFTLENTMVTYKSAVLRQRSGEVGTKTSNTDVLSCVMRFVLLPSLAKPRHHRNERDIGTISMCLHFFRNMLAIRDPVATTLSSAEQISNAALQSELVVAMSQSHILETLIMLANSAESREFAQWNTITAECFYIIYGGESAATITNKNRYGVVGSWRSNQNPNKSNSVSSSANSKTSELTSFLNAEAHEKRKALGITGSARHSRFGTTFNFYTTDGDRRVARNASSIRKTVDELRAENVTKSRRKIRRRKQAREQGAPSVRPEWSSAAKQVLRDVADRLLLSSGFETLTRSVLGDIRSERVRVGDLEEARIRLMILASFFLEYFLYRKDEAAEEAKKNPKPLNERDANANTTPPTLTTPPVDKGKAREISPRPEDSTNIPESSTDATPTWSFSLLAEWLKPWAFKMVLVRSIGAMEDKGWLELTASLQLWMALLRLIDALSRSELERERDVAESLQANHFYQSETLDICSSISKCYSTQSFEFLQTIIAFVFVMPKMLEKYCMNKEHIFVRAKHHVRKSRAKAGADGNGDDAEHRGTEEEESAERAKVVYSDRRFDFDKFQNKLCNRPLVEACVAYLGRWRDMSNPSEQLNNVVSVMHRIAIKANDVRSFYPAHIRLAFSALLKGSLVPAMEPRAPTAAKDVKKLMEYVLKRFDKLSAEDKAVWALGQKPPKRLAAEKPIKLPREIQVKPGFFNRDESVGIAVGLLLEKKMMSRVMWVKQGLETAVAERVGVRLHIDGQRLLRSWRRQQLEDGEKDITEDSAEPTPEEKAAVMVELENSVPSDEALAAFEPYVLRTDDRSATDDDDLVEGQTLTQDATASPALKLLCRLLGLESDEDDAREWKWRVPVDLLPTHLEADIKLIEQYILTPLELPQGAESFEALTMPAVRRRRPRTGAGASAGALVPEDIDSDGDAGDTSSGSESESDEDASASDVEKRQQQRRRRAREDLRGDPRKKKKNKGYRRKDARAAGPLFLQDDMIDSDEDEQVEKLWREHNQNSHQDAEGAGAGDQVQRSRCSSHSEDEEEQDDGTSTPPTSPSSPAPRRSRPKAKPATAAGTASGPGGVKASSRQGLLFLGSDDEDEDDEEEEQQAPPASRSTTTTGTKSVALSPSPSPSPPPVPQSLKRSTLHTRLDSDDEEEHLGLTQRPVKRRQVILDDDDDEGDDDF